jgi:hypothetical protein
MAFNSRHCFAGGRAAIRMFNIAHAQKVSDSAAFARTFNHRLRLPYNCKLHSRHSADCPSYRSAACE